MQAWDLGGIGRAVGAADQKALAALGRQQLDRVDHAGGAAGQCNDAVGIAIKLDLLDRQHRQEPDEAECEQHGDAGAEHDRHTD